TDALVSALAGMRQKPKVLVAASAVGYYGDRDDEVLDETAAPGSGFLSKVCIEWEASAARAMAFGMRVVMLRTGVVIGRGGGALAKMMGPFRFGAGGPLGSGRQFVPWIHLDDIAHMYVFAIENEALSGPVNAVTPDYATSSRVAQAIGAAMRRPSLAPAPALALRAVLGEFAQTVLGSQLVMPRLMQRAAFRWRYPRLEEALQEIIDPSRPCTLLERYSCRQFVNAPHEQVFAFFADARNLEALTPPSLRFSIRSAPSQMREGSVIDYRLRLHGIPFGWKTLISRWKPLSAFTDVQLHGPYALWEHLHTFQPVDGGVEIGDDVIYALPFAPLSRIAAGFVRGDLERIFAHRRQIIAQRFTT
ncbi:MAG TPA: TIGR01777 family oxidoreductase, partial [Candidatus Baltobacteraceae bacterium]|nr:TIGR01777 family oxidoreductase [Candidatus Baltobacteraceae bacterium]